MQMLLRRCALVSSHSTVHVLEVSFPSETSPDKQQTERFQLGRVELSENGLNVPGAVQQLLDPPGPGPLTSGPPGSSSGGGIDFLGWLLLLLFNISTFDSVLPSFLFFSPA